MGLMERLWREEIVGVGFTVKVVVWWSLLWLGEVEWMIARWWEGWMRTCGEFRDLYFGMGRVFEMGGRCVGCDVGFLGVDYVRGGFGGLERALQ